MSHREREIERKREVTKKKAQHLYNNIKQSFVFRGEGYPLMVVYLVKKISNQKENYAFKEESMFHDSV